MEVIQNGGKSCPRAVSMKIPLGSRAGAQFDLSKLKKKLNTLETTIKYNI
jgi:hypothetical protein